MPSAQPLGPRFRGDEREGVPTSFYSPVYWNDEWQRVRPSPKPAPPRAEPTARPARFKSNDR